MIQEKDFEIFLNDKTQEMMIMISEKPDCESCPQVLYDGSDHALLHRNDSQIILLDYINPLIKEPLMHHTQVYIVEIGPLGNVVREYKAPVKIVPHLPLGNENTDQLDLPLQNIA